MMVRTQISLENELQRRARRRAGEIGISFAEYVRRLVEDDLTHPQSAANVAEVFDLGSSRASDIAQDKDSMIANAFHSVRRRKRR
jgi:hypothetical protein